MAARWKWEDGNLNAGNGDFLGNNIPQELVLSGGDVVSVEMDTESCVDHFILAIFEDSAMATENKSGVEEESETLLSALSEMLDSVEDDDTTLSPFDTLPDTEFFIRQEHTDNSAEESLANRLRRPRPKSQSVSFAKMNDVEKKDWRREQSDSLQQKRKALIPSSNQVEVASKQAETDVEIFRSASLVNLVNIMHSYCLKLHVEEEEGTGWRDPTRSVASSWDKLRKKRTIFSQGEIWKYEKPTGDNDEEINVVSDDEITVNETKQDEALNKRRDKGILVKSVLMNGNSCGAPQSRKKKRVSFGPVQVAPFDESEEKEINLKNVTSDVSRQTGEKTVPAPLINARTPENPICSAPEPLTPSSEINCIETKFLPPPSEAKVKSLSLQQYRQLQQKRQPLVEKQKNYTTKWPSLSEPPKELTPILCLEGQRQNSWGPKMGRHYPFSTRSSSQTFGCKTSSCPSAKSHRLELVEAKPSSHIRHIRKSKCPRTESKIISPASLLSDVTAAPAVNVPESKKSPAKRPTLLGSDPPNPVLLPLLLTKPANDKQKASPSIAWSSSEHRVVLFNREDSDLQSNGLLKEIQKNISIQLLKKQAPSVEPKSHMLLNEDRNLPTNLPQEMNNFTEIGTDEKPQLPSLCPSTTQAKSTSGCKKLKYQQYSSSLMKETKVLPEIPQSPNADLTRQTKCPSSISHTAQLPTPVNSPTAVREMLPEVPLIISPPEEPSPLPQFSCRVQSAPGDSGIEASDLASLLEQFEETQAKEEVECESDLQTACEHISDGNRPLESSCSSNTPEMPELLTTCMLSTENPLYSQEPNAVVTPKLDKVAPPPDLKRGLVPDTTQPVGAETGPKISLTPSVEPLKILPHPQSLVVMDIPEPLGTDIVLSSQERFPANQQLKLFSSASQREQPARRKNPPSKAIQIIDPRPLPSKKTHSSPPEFPALYLSPQTYLFVFLDHDYCEPAGHSFTDAAECSKAKISTSKDFSSLTNKMQVTNNDLSATSECSKQSTTCKANTTLMAVKSEACTSQHLCEDHRTTSETLITINHTNEHGSADDKCKETLTPCSLPTPPPSPSSRGREKRRYRRRSPRSDSSSGTRSMSSSSSSSSASRSPKRKKFHHRCSESSSCSSSRSRSISRSPPRRSRLPYSRSRRSRSRSKSLSQPRSPSPHIHRRRWRDVYSPSYRRSRRESKCLRREHEMRIQKLKAIDQRRVVYVGHIRRSMTHDELRERFSLFGEVECVSLHFRDGGDHYGFVTFYNMEDAFAAIDNGSKTRRPDELPFDICFGGRRQFCTSYYSDLDADREIDPTPAQNRFEELDFDSLLKQAQRGLKR
ncbi:hypothetical protein LDENG_00267770 [Lucifuga dentata]|nr:hypothetical protein LDENG_00267770 [Lucifuga dentata]